MKAVILAAGEGKRLRPFTETMPKVMLPVANKPILEYVFDALKNSGVNGVIVVVGYKKEVIMEYFKDYKGLDITYVHQDKQLGTSDALFKAEGCIDDAFLVLSGDNLIASEGINELIIDKSEYSMLVKEHHKSSKYGSVIIEKNSLKKIIKEPEDKTGGFISTGIYKFPTSVFKIVEELISQGDYSLFSVVQKIVDSGCEIKTISTDLWMDIVYAWDLIRINEFMMKDISSKKGGIIEDNVTMKGPVFVGKNTVVHSGCYIVGPVVIGEGCEIGPNACIFPSTSIGDNSVVRPFCEIGNSIVMDDVHVGSSSFVYNSMIGRGCNIGNGFSSDSEDAVVEIENVFKKIDNIGSMIGEDCVIGSNVVVDPGVVIGRKCKISSLKHIIKNIKSQSEVM